MNNLDYKAMINSRNELDNNISGKLLKVESKYDSKRHLCLHFDSKHKTFNKAAKGIIIGVAETECQKSIYIKISNIKSESVILLDRLQNEFDFVPDELIKICSNQTSDILIYKFFNEFKGRDCSTIHGFVITEAQTHKLIGIIRVGAGLGRNTIKSNSVIELAAKYVSWTDKIGSRMGTKYQGKKPVPKKFKLKSLTSNKRRSLKYIKSNIKALSGLLKENKEVDQKDLYLLVNFNYVTKGIIYDFNESMPTAIRDAKTLTCTIMKYTKVLESISGLPFSFEIIKEEEFSHLIEHIKKINEYYKFSYAKYKKKLTPIRLLNLWKNASEMSISDRIVVNRETLATNFKYIDEVCSVAINSKCRANTLVLYSGILGYYLSSGRFDGILHCADGDKKDLPLTQNMIQCGRMVSYILGDPTMNVVLSRDMTKDYQNNFKTAIVAGIKFIEKRVTSFLLGSPYTTLYNMNSKFILESIGIKEKEIFDINIKNQEN